MYTPEERMRMSKLSRLRAPLRSEATCAEAPRTLVTNGVYTTVWLHAVVTRLLGDDSLHPCSRGVTSSYATHTHVVVEGGDGAIARVAQDGDELERGEGRADRACGPGLAQIKGTSLKAQPAGRLALQRRREAAAALRPRRDSTMSAKASASRIDHPLPLRQRGCPFEGGHVQRPARSRRKAVPLQVTLKTREEAKLLVRWRLDLKEARRMGCVPF